MSSHSGWHRMLPRCLLLCPVLHPVFLSCLLPGDFSLCFLAFPSSLVLSSLYLLLHTPWAQLLSLIIMVVMIRSIATVSFCSLIQDSLNCLWSCPEWPGSFSNHVAASCWNCRSYIHSPSFQFTQSSMQSGLYKSPPWPPAYSRILSWGDQGVPWFEWLICLPKKLGSLELHSLHWACGSSWQRLPSFSPNPFFFFCRGRLHLVHIPTGFAVTEWKVM